VCPGVPPASRGGGDLHGWWRVYGASLMDKCVII
jgi:hypothetical protein